MFGENYGASLIFLTPGREAVQEADLVQYNMRKNRNLDDPGISGHLTGTLHLGCRNPKK
jgi:hypothetical protein